jgi:hypothetical protein
MDERREHGEIVLGGIDRPFRFGRRGPRQARPDDGFRLALEQLDVGNASGYGAGDVETVEGRDAGSRLHDVDARIGEVEAPLGGTDGEPQQQSFAPTAIRLRCQIGGQLPAQRVEQ